MACVVEKPLHSAGATVLRAGRNTKVSRLRRFAPSVEMNKREGRVGVEQVGAYRPFPQRYFTGASTRSRSAASPSVSTNR